MSIKGPIKHFRNLGGQIIYRSLSYPCIPIKYYTTTIRHTHIHPHTHTHTNTHTHIHTPMHTHTQSVQEQIFTMDFKLVDVVFRRKHYNSLINSTPIHLPTPQAQFYNRHQKCKHQKGGGGDQYPPPSRAFRADGN